MQLSKRERRNAKRREAYRTWKALRAQDKAQEPKRSFLEYALAKADVAKAWEGTYYTMVQLNAAVEQYLETKEMPTAPERT